VGRVGCLLEPGQAAEWTFVAGGGFLAAVPVGTPPSIVATLTALVPQARVEIEAVMALLPLSGEQAVESFAVVVPGDPTDGDGVPVSAVVRGAIAVDVFSVGGSRRFTDRDIRPWLLADFQAVIGVVIGSPRRAVVPADRLGAGQGLGLGAVSGNALFWTLDGVARTTSPADDGRVAPETAAIPGRLRDPEPLEADTILRPRQAVQDTVIIRRRGHREEPAEAGQAPPPPMPDPVPERARYGFRLPDGGECRLDAVYHLGRRPRPPRISAGPPPRLVPVPSRTNTVSGTHLEIRQEGDSVVVTDLGSTNGTVVIPPRGRKRRLGPGQSLAVAPGTTVDIGDGNIIEILRASDR
jgi:hypothetical protein